MWSFWETESFIGQPDLLVVGSGIVGLSAAIAYRSRHPKARVLVLEAGHLPAGASTKNAGFACFGSPSELLMDLEESPADEVFALLERRWRGLANLRQLLGDLGIGYEAPGSYELFTEADAASHNHCLNQLDRLNTEAEQAIGFRPYVRSDEVPGKYGFAGMVGAIQIKGEGQIDTGRMMTALLGKARSLDIEIINGLRVERVEPVAGGVEVITRAGAIQARKCLVATNGFATQLLAEIKLEPARAQVLVTEPIPNLPFRGTFHFDQGYCYFRNVGDRILFGGARNLDFSEETTAEQGLNPLIQDELNRMLQEVILPGHEVKVERRWTGIMGVGHAKVPVLRQVGDHLYAAVRLGGMGIAIGSLLGKEAADLLEK